jgi:hypothetical protein
MFLAIAEVGTLFLFYYKVWPDDDTMMLKHVTNKVQTN